MFILDICCPLSYPLLSRRGTRVFLSFLFVSRNLSFNGVNRFRQIGLAGMCLEFFSRTKKRHSGRDGTRAHRVGNTCSSTIYFSNGALYKGQLFCCWGNRDSNYIFSFLYCLECLSYYNSVL